MSTSAFVAEQCPAHNRLAHLHHVLHAAHVRGRLVGPVAAIHHRAVLGALGQVVQDALRLLQVALQPPNAAVVPHRVGQLGLQLVGVLLAVRVGQAGIVRFVALTGVADPLAVQARRVGVHLAQISRDALGGEFAAGQARKQRVGAQAVRTVVLVVCFPGGIQARDARHLVARAIQVQRGAVGALFVVHPQAAHGVVHGRVNAHRLRHRVFAHKLLVDLQYATQLVHDEFTGHAALAVQVRNVEVHLLATLHPASHAAHAVDDEADNVARKQVAVNRVKLFAHVPAVGFGDVRRRARIHRITRHPHAAAFAAHRFAHQATLVLARDGGGVNLHHFRVAVNGPFLVGDAHRLAGVDDGVRRLAEDHPVPTRGDAHRIRREGFNLHGAQVLRHDAARATLIVLDEPEESPAFKLLHQVAAFVAAHLLIQRIKQLLARGGPRVGGAVLQRAPKPAEREQAFRSAVERHAHAVQQVDDGGRALGHAHHRRLVVQKVAARNRVFKVQIRRVAFPAQVHRPVDAPLGTHAVTALDGDQAEELNLHPRFRELHGGHQAGEAPSNDDDSALRHSASRSYGRIRVGYGRPRSFYRAQTRQTWRTIPKGACRWGRAGSVRCRHRRPCHHPYCAAANLLHQSQSCR